MGKHTRKICLLVLNLGDPWASMSMPAEGEGWLWRMSDQWWVGPQIQVQIHGKRRRYTELALTLAGCCCCRALGPGLFSLSPWFLLLLESIPCRVYQHDAKVGHLIHLGFVMYLLQCSFESSRTWIPGPGSTMRLCNLNSMNIWMLTQGPIPFIETERLCSIFLFQSPPGACLEGYALRVCILSLSAVSESLWFHGL